MKKTIAALLPVFALCFALSGCMRDNANNSTMVSPDITPMVTLSPSASMMPEKEDGMVTDENGTIGDKEKDNTVDYEGAAPSPNPSGTPSASPSPSANP